MEDFPLSSALRLLRWAVHGTFWALLVIALVAALREERAVELAGGVLLGALYGALHGSGPALGRVWLGLVTACWVALAVAAPEFVWPAFPLLFAYLRLLPLWAAMFGVTVMTSAAIMAAGWHAGELSAALVVGPAAGAAVMTSLALAYEALSGMRAG
ncbi:MAG: hypothetical protein HOV96_32740 [Nonomuraea sp.]|nr:hypothetical protein [Nonomuraea sp.]NUP63790.1 hypothetical protein [Nonomuraea sp.]NUP82320.1 hypothetical protein [Nonomuraea sp.]NUS08105.1 hypothetical protein [Nonomuraea sp.]NUT12233.1 hypothetical protein [Nonomuraea sp.]